MNTFWCSKKKRQKNQNKKKDESNVEFKCNLATPFNIIIKDIIDRINKPIVKILLLEVPNIEIQLI